MIGFMAPAMLNMTTVQTSIQMGKRSGVFFAIGAALINTIQALIAFSFLRYFDNNPEIILVLKKVGIFILFSLAFFFYRKSKKEVSSKEVKDNLHPFFQGMFMSTINMLAIPYYFGTALGLEAAEQIIVIKPYIYYLSAGVFIGGAIMFSIYAIAAHTISKRSEFIVKNLNLLLCYLFVTLGMIMMINIFLM